MKVPPALLSCLVLACSTASPEGGGSDDLTDVDAFAGMADGAPAPDAPATPDAASGSADADVGPPDASIDAPIDAAVDAPIDAAVDAPIDAMPDAGGPCDPVGQTGCAPGEKCTSVVVSESPYETETDCVEDGTVALGGSCTTDSPPTGWDDCAAGGLCSGGVCTEICSTSSDSCPSGGACVQISDRFDDIGGTGICENTCDVLTQDCTGGDGCYMDLDTGVGTCATPLADPDVPGATDPGVQGEECNYLNTCAVGYGCILLDQPNNATGLECAFFCDASSSGGPGCADGPGSSYECVQVNTFYSDTPDVPDDVGMCVDPVEWNL